MVVEAAGAFSFVAGLTLVLATAHTLGVVADRLGFAPVVGELLTGLVLGPAVLGLVAPAVTAILVPVPEPLAALSFLGLVLLLVVAGTEVDVALLRRSLGSTLALAVGASVVPFALGFALGWLLPARYLVAPAERLAFALFLATALSISAVPVAVRVLADLDALDRRVGQLTLTAAVLIDAAGWVVLTVVSDVARTGGVDAGALSRTVVALAGFVALTLAVGPRVVARLFDATDRSRTPVLSGFSVVIVFGFALAGAAIGLGLEPVLGAFLAGLLVRTRLDPATRRVVETATLGLFAPLFFATAGLRADLSGLLAPDAVALAAVTLTVAIVGKGLGVAVGALFTDLTRTETACLAIGLNARGAMEIVVAAIGLSIGVLTPTMYTVVVVVAIVTSVMTPPLLRRALARLPDGTPPEGTGATP